MPDCHKKCKSYTFCAQEKYRTYQKEYGKMYRLREDVRDRNKQAGKKHRAENPDRHLRANFGITGEQYDAMLAEQGGVCAICKESATGEHVTRGYKLSVDHCHETGEVRGILCGKCNRALGCMNDNPELLIAAANYLQAGGHRSRKVRKVA